MGRNLKGALERHSYVINVLCNVSLILVSLVCYLLLLLLYLSPSSYQLSSLIYPESGSFKPTVAVGLITAVFSGATSAFVTRAVEHSLWLKLAPRTITRPVTVGESHRLAQWTVSPLARLTYLLDGHSWLLRFGGILLLATAVLNPVLISGISQQSQQSTSTSRRSPSVGGFSGFLDRSNSAYNGGNFQDNLMSVAALAHMSNVSAPASSRCSDPSCQIKASASSVRADCNFYELDNPDRIGTKTLRTSISREYCSNINPNLCRTLSKSDPHTFANFTTGPGAGCSHGNDPKCVGSWSTVFGVWVNVIGSTSSAALPVNKVDCVLSYGNVTILQRGGSTPELSRQTFVKSRYPPDAFSYAVAAWYRIQRATRPNIASPLGLLLLNYATGDSAETVARRIEANFDTATLFAFARAPEAVDRTITYTTSTPIWVYNPTVLAILLVPFIATALGLWGRWRVGDDKTVIGYNSVEIARRGLVQGSSGFAAIDVSPQGDQNKEEVEKLHVWGLKEVRRLESGVCEVGAPLVIGRA